jgi:hypothetical protein
MSVKLVGIVLDHAVGLPAPAKFVLVVLAQHANEKRDDALSWPGVETIARKVGLSSRQVRSHLRLLEAKQWIKREGSGRGGRKSDNEGITTMYRINIAMLKPGSTLPRTRTVQPGSTLPDNSASKQRQYPEVHGDLLGNLASSTRKSSVEYPEVHGDLRGSVLPPNRKEQEVQQGKATGMNRGETGSVSPRPSDVRQGSKNADPRRTPVREKLPHEIEAERQRQLRAVQQRLAANGETPFTGKTAPSFNGRPVSSSASSATASTAKPERGSEFDRAKARWERGSAARARAAQRKAKTATPLTNPAKPRRPVAGT